MSGNSVYASERHTTELNSILSNLPDPVLSVGLKGGVDMINHAAQELFSKPAR